MPPATALPWVHSGLKQQYNLKKVDCYSDIDPMIWIPEEQLYIRIEDVALVTEHGVENLSAFAPSSIKEIEKVIKEKGLTEFRPAKSLPLKAKK